MVSFFRSSGRGLATALPLLAATGATAASAADGSGFQASLVNDYLNNVSGGLRSGDDTIVQADLAMRLALPRGQLLIHGALNNNETFSLDRVGDTQVVSSIEGPEVNALYELYYEHYLADGRASLLVGLWDLNTEIDVIEPAALFQHSSHGMGPDFSQSGVAGPSIFPTTAAVLRGRARLGERWEMSVAVADAVPRQPGRPQNGVIDIGRKQGALVAGELRHALASGAELNLGAWSYTRDFPVIGDPGRSDESRGAYASLWGRLPPLAGRLTGFLRLGAATDEVNQIGTYLGAGLVLEQPLPGRPGDRAGVALALARAGDRFRSQGAERAETAVEVTYRFQLTDNLALQPTVHYVANPGFDPSLDDAFVVGLRVEIAGGVAW